MARGPAITDYIKALITKLYIEHPTWAKKEIRNWISNELRKQNPTLPSNFPSLRTIYNVLAEIEIKIFKENPQDLPWSMASLDEYPIPPEALPTVLSFWKQYCLKQEQERFTVRRAKWIARLCKMDLEQAEINFYSEHYTTQERLLEISGRPNNTKYLDMALMNISLPLPYEGEQQNGFEIFELLGRDLVEASNTFFDKKSPKFKKQKSLKKR